MKTSNFDAVLASSPSNRDVAIAVSGGESWTPAVKFSEELFDIRPPTKAVDGSCRRAGHDLTGASFGRLKVVGLSESASNGASWVCRCSCGFFVRRKAKVLKAGTSDRCSQCMYVKKLREGQVVAALSTGHIGDS